ncbi:MAG TPA: HAD-IA family hydrolase [Gemmatimonadales bacterium]|nr:HAD-IA family hydrolase [Gemmatimonadales bacterium]
MTVRAVLFDAGNTLLGLDHERIAPAVAKALDVPLTAAALRAASPRAALAMEEGRSSDQERALRYLKLLFEYAGVPASRIDEVNKVLWPLHAEQNLWSGVEPGTAAALERLQVAGYRLGVVSNSDGRVAEALEGVGLARFFGVIVDSKLVGYEKPDPRIFMPALASLGVAPAEALYVGDLYEVDVVGARAAGMTAVLLDPAGLHASRDVPTARDVAAVADRLLANGAFQ